MLTLYVDDNNIQVMCSSVHNGTYNIGVGAGPAGQVLAGPLLSKPGKNETSFLQKASNEQKC